MVWRGWSGAICQFLNVLPESWCPSWLWSHVSETFRVLDAQWTICDTGSTVALNRRRLILSTTFGSYLPSQLYYSSCKLFPRSKSVMLPWYRDSKCQTESDNCRCTLQLKYFNQVPHYLHADDVIRFDWWIKSHVQACLKVLLIPILNANS